MGYTILPSEKLSFLTEWVNGKSQSVIGETIFLQISLLNSNMFLSTFQISLTVSIRRIFHIEFVTVRLILSNLFTFPHLKTKPKKIYLILPSGVQDRNLKSRLLSVT